MFRHVRPFKRLVYYRPNHNIEFCEAGAVMYYSDVRYSQPPSVASKYRIPLMYTLTVPNRDDRAHLPQRGYITVYKEQLKAGLRFSLYPFIRNILMY